ncbi:MAG: family hydrolase [Verrucomicrobiaceae bacterium]|nr:family hydrolase [Verrucomicrobiaceae bacterium]
MSNERIKLLTFDLDDTLWEFAPVLERAEAVIYRWFEENIPAVAQQFTMKQLRDLRVQVARERPDLGHRVTELRKYSLRRAMVLAGVAESEIEAFTAAAFKVFLEARHQVQLFDAAESVLEQLQRDFTLAAITNGNFDINTIGFDRYFAFAINAERLARPKPHPEPFEEALRISGYAPHQCIHIGDDVENDVRGAQRMGFATIWMNSVGAEWPGGELPSKQIRHLQELPDAVREIAAQFR